MGECRSLDLLWNQVVKGAIMIVRQTLLVGATLCHRVPFRTGP